MPSIRRRVVLSLLAAGALALLWPPPSPPVPAGAGGTPFVWDRDALWDRLEARFRDARQSGCPAVDPEIEAGLAAVDAALERAGAAPAGSPAWDELEAALFETAPLVAACPAGSERWIDAVARVRFAAKDASRAWDPEDRVARERLYRLLYGSRIATEEILLQAPDGAVPPLLRGVDEPSAAPSALVHGVRVHSGDLLLSRGGAPTSALIARGNDFPGNFSHVALAHVAEDGTVSAIEAHIESGVGVSTLDRYLADKKLRILVLRLRADLPALREDPSLPHRVASEALAEARARHIAYDFAMDFADPTERFCSEVASVAYASGGIRLWQGLSSMSGPGVTRWLAGFGVRHFSTQAPSDLEYDPQLRVVAEWRDPGTLFADHVDNAVIEAMLARADAGEELPWNRPLLPAVRAAKAWSVLLNAVGRVGPVPEGMSAATALRVKGLQARHGEIKDDVLRRAAAFERELGYRPPYWALVRMAEEAASLP